tara:strand:+ start:192 stop:440 length:249 start_codon:yes stop_codon:yes gene_type:complete
MNMSKYAKGYQPKIEYWTKMLNNEMFNTKQPNFERVLEIKEKLTYFCNRQLELNDMQNMPYPTFTSPDVINRMEEQLDSITR